MAVNTPCNIESQKFKNLLHHLKIQLPTLSASSNISDVDFNGLLLNEQPEQPERPEQQEFLPEQPEFLSSTVDQNAILYEFQSAFSPVHQEDVNSILAEIISDYGPKEEQSKN